MLSGRKFLLLLLVLPMALAAGCQWLALVGAVTGTYIADGANATKHYTAISNSGGAKYVMEAMKVWQDRNQLPMPSLPEGSHSFGFRVGNPVEVQASRGARNVQMFDGDRLIAEYVVAWDRNPEEYRLVSATNRLYDSVLDVDEVPTLQIQPLAN